jgi:hypothetical protein
VIPYTILLYSVYCISNFFWTIPCAKFYLLSPKHLIAPSYALFSQLLKEHKNLAAIAEADLDVVSNIFFWVGNATCEKVPTRNVQGCKDLAEHLAHISMLRMRAMGK